MNKNESLLSKETSESVKINYTIVGKEKADELRKSFAEKFISPTSKKKFIWERLDSPTIIKRDVAFDLLARMDEVYVIWEERVPKGILPSIEGKLPRGIMIKTDARKLIYQIKRDAANYNDRFLPEDLYIFDKALSQYVVFMHELHPKTDGEPMCLTNAEIKEQNTDKIINRIPDDGMELLNSLIGKKLTAVSAPSIQYITFADYYDFLPYCYISTRETPTVRLGVSFEKLENGLYSPAFVISEDVDPIELRFSLSSEEVRDCGSRIIFRDLNDIIEKVTVYETNISNEICPEGVTYDSHIVLDLVSGKSVIFETVSIPTGFIRMRICETDKAEFLIREEHSSIFDPIVRRRASARISDQDCWIRHIAFAQDCKIDVDYKKTYDIYHSDSYPKNPCNCGNCVAFRRGIDRISDTAKSYFARLGIDPAKPVEVYTCGRSARGTVYDGWYHVCGNVVKASHTGAAPTLYDDMPGVQMKGYITVAPDLLVSVSEKCDMLPKGFPTPAFDINIQIVIPDRESLTDRYVDIVGDYINRKLNKCTFSQALDKLALECYAIYKEKLTIESAFVSSLIAYTTCDTEESYNKEELCGILAKLRSGRPIYLKAHINILPQQLTQDQIEIVTYLQNVIAEDYSPEAVRGKGYELFYTEREERLYKTIPEALIGKAAYLFFGYARHDGMPQEKSNPYQDDARERIAQIVSILSGVRGAWIETDGVRIGSI